MPWITGYVLCKKDRHKLLPPDLRNLASSLIQELRMGYENNHVCRDVLENRICLHPNQKSVGPLVPVLFGLRFLDVACMVSGSSTVPGVHSKPKTVLQGSTAKLRGVGSLSEQKGWPSILLHLRTLLHLSGCGNQAISSPHETAGSPVRQLVLAASRQLGSISSRPTDTEVTKALTNLDAAALFMNYMIQGRHDLPSSSEDLVSELTGAADYSPQTAFASGVSGFTSYIAIGHCAAVDELDSIAHDKSLVSLRKQASWNACTSGKDTLGSFIRDRQRPDDFFGRAGDVSARGFPSIISRIARKRFLSPILSSGEIAVMPTALEYDHSDGAIPCKRRAISSEENALEQITVGGAFSVVESSFRIPGTLDKEPVNTLMDIRASLQRTVGDPPSDDEYPCDSLSPRRLGSGSLTRSFPCSDRSEWAGVGLVGSHAAPSVSFRSSIRTRSFCSDWRKLIKGDSYLLLSPSKKQRTYWPSLYDAAALDLVASLLDRSNAYQQKHGNTLLFHCLTSSASTCTSMEDLLCALAGARIEGVHCISSDQWLRSHREESLSGSIRSGHILIFGNACGDESSYKSVLDEIGGYRELHDVIDFSLSAMERTSSEGPFQASFLDFVEEGCTIAGRGRIMCFPSIPDRRDGSVPCLLSTSAFSRAHSFSFPGLETQQGWRQSLNWHFVGSANAYHFPKTAPVGFNVEIAVKEGAILLFLGMSSGNVMGPSTISSVLDNVLDSDDIIGLLLLAGDSIILRPATPHCVIPIEPTVYHGSYFYCKSTMQQTYWSILRRFLNGKYDCLADNVASLDKLSSIAAFWHNAIANRPSHYMGCCTSSLEFSRHVPNALTLDGITELFSLLAVVEFGTLLWDRRYLAGGISNKLEVLYQQLRRLGFEILDALNRNMRIRDQQCVALLKIYGGHDNSLITPAELKVQLLLDLDRDKVMLYLVQTLLREDVCEFGSPINCRLSAKDCMTFEWSLVQDFGSRYRICVHAESGQREGPGREASFPDDPVNAERPAKRLRSEH
ncbi:hypothetical protein VNI00_006250 [Paramarasmius palmivorus]|uniref:Uncharacterized protein n=1 Tax=Paramarasmius palmivorus TaxID=297713 RepID=A0AAW0DBH4_9AGAR